MAPRTSAHRPPAPIGAPARPSIRDFSGRARGYAVEWDVRSVYDFVFSLSDDAGLTDDLPAEDQRWLAEAKGRLRAAVGDAVDLYGSDLCVPLAGLAVDRPDVRDAAAFVDLIAGASPDLILRTVLGEQLRNPDTQGLAERAIAGDEAAAQELVRTFDEHPPDKRERLVALARAMVREPERVVRPALSLLTAWLAEFAPIEKRVTAMIRRDYEDRAADRATLGPVELVEKTTGGIRWLSEPGVRRVILAPSYFARPYNFLLSAGDWRLFGYPIADTALDASDPLAPPQSVVRLHRALGDDTRLRILKLLATRDWYLTEIAQQLELSKPTIKHHLALLRAAGLVTVTEEAAVIYYSLRRSRLDDASSELRRFIG